MVCIVAKDKKISKYYSAKTRIICLPESLYVVDRDPLGRDPVRQGPSRQESRICRIYNGHRIPKFILLYYLMCL